jgi:protein TonB
MALAMVAVMDIKPHLQPEKFQWDVVLHEAPAPSPVASEDKPPQKFASEPAPPQPVPQTMQPPAKPPVRRTVERTPVVQTAQTVQSVQSTPRVVERSSTQERQAVTTEMQTMAAQPVRQEVVARAQELTQQDIHEATQSSEQSIIAASSPVVVSQPAASVVEAQTAAVEQPAVVQQSAVLTTEQTATPLAAIAEKGRLEESEPAIVRREIVEHRVVREVAQSQADFGWLSESLWKRIEQLKRYPMQARARRWEGKVVLEAVIRQDGTILECLVAESSGHGILDQDAVSVLRRASPLALKHPLGQEQITILVPIAYRLES